MTSEASFRRGLYRFWKEYALPATQQLISLHKVFTSFSFYVAAIKSNLFANLLEANNIVVDLFASAKEMTACIKLKNGQMNTKLINTDKKLGKGSEIYCQRHTCKCIRGRVAIMAPAFSFTQIMEIIRMCAVQFSSSLNANSCGTGMQREHHRKCYRVMPHTRSTKT